MKESMKETLEYGDSGACGTAFRQPIHQSTGGFEDSVTTTIGG